MASLAVVKHFDVREQRTPGRVTRGIALVMDQLFLECGED
jgi:hypothetical protein